MASEQRSAAEDVVTFMYVPGRTGSIRRYNIRRSAIRNATYGLIGLAALFLVASVDYVIVRLKVPELDRLRQETHGQREQIDTYATQMEQIAGHLARIDELEQKLRVITNLDPADPTPLPGIGGAEGGLMESGDLTWLTPERRHARLVENLSSLGEAAEGRTDTLATLVQHLEDQSARLLHTPSITPTKGWVTSAFGYRTSPFTGNREFHKGIDIAGRMGTPVVAAANGTVRFAGNKRALGKTVVIRHGYGVETFYGHMADVNVKPGQKVKRGERVGSMGTTGRSTGPHLHYQVVVNRKAVNPRNYILD